MVPSQRNDSVALFAVAVVTILTVRKLKKIAEERDREREKQKLLVGMGDGLLGTSVQKDAFYLRLAHDLRLKLDRPQQSSFRVATILLLEGGTMILGTNDEPSPNIAMSLCAERCAFLRYRVQQKHELVKTVYIVTDSDTPVSPGMACREYMYGHPATRPTTRVVLQSKVPESEPLILTLAELQPFPSIYIGLKPEEQLEMGGKYQQRICMALEQLQVPGLSQQNMIRLVKAARDACQLDDRDSLHAIRYGAAIALEQEKGHIEILQASQLKALEYGLTLDAVCQLASQVLALTKNSQNKSGPRVVAVVQVDQFGIPHSLFAHARSFLTEFGFGDCSVILTSMDKTKASDDPLFSIQSVPAKDLAPFVPDFRS
jgi:cytidine deaminase